MAFMNNIAADPGPEIGQRILANGIQTNYLQAGEGPPVVLVHGSGPGVSAWTNWRLNIPVLAQQYAVYAPDLVGFGFTERPLGTTYDLPTWRAHLLGFLDALGLDRVSLVGNSFGGGLVLSAATVAPERVDKLVLMGATGVSFPLTPGLDAVWGYEPSFDNMSRLMDYFAYDRTLVNDDLTRARYEASIRPGFQESFAAMFPAPRQQWIDALTVPEDDVRALAHETLILHGRDDQVIPVANALRLLDLIDRSQAHLFGRCGHWTQIEHTAEFNRLVGDFLAR